MTKYIKLIDYMGSDQAIGDSARISYGKANQGKECENLINYLMEHDHSSPFEMAELIFEVKAPIFIARQWMRHRTFSYEEERTHIKCVNQLYDIAIKIQSKHLYLDAQKDI